MPQTTASRRDRRAWTVAAADHGRHLFRRMAHRERRGACRHQIELL